jgi:hypothetical protein
MKRVKALFERQGQSLLPFIGEPRSGVRVTSVDVVELPAPKRTIDSVLRLERDGLFWYRHLEFQAQRDPDIPRRCFEYNWRLILHTGAAVFTTVPTPPSNPTDSLSVLLEDRASR